MNKELKIPKTEQTYGNKKEKRKINFPTSARKICTILIVSGLALMGTACSADEQNSATEAPIPTPTPVVTEVNPYSPDLFTLNDELVTSRGTFIFQEVGLPGVDQQKALPKVLNQIKLSITRYSNIFQINRGFSTANPKILVRITVTPPLYANESASLITRTSTNAEVDIVINSEAEQPHVDHETAHVIVGGLIFGETGRTIGSYGKNDVFQEALEAETASWFISQNRKPLVLATGINFNTQSASIASFQRVSPGVGVPMEHNNLTAHRFNRLMYDAMAQEWVNLFNKTGGLTPERYEDFIRFLRNNINLIKKDQTGAYLQVLTEKYFQVKSSDYPFLEISKPPTAGNIIMPFLTFDRGLEVFRFFVSDSRDIPVIAMPSIASGTIVQKNGKITPIRDFMIKGVGYPEVLEVDPAAISIITVKTQDGLSSVINLNP